MGVGVDTTQPATRRSTRVREGVDTGVGKGSEKKCRNRDFKTLTLTIEGRGRREKKIIIRAFIVEEKTSGMDYSILIFVEIYSESAIAMAFGVPSSFSRHLWNLHLLLFFFFTFFF